MKHSKKLTLASAGLAIALTSLPVTAQTLEEVVVTARRQSESLQDVPASVSVITAGSLERSGATVAEDFIQLTPGVTIVTGTAEAGDTQINIRGINGARDAESSVALIVDGILKTNTAQLNQDHGTVRQVEILKGPQGAIYGRNAAAGAMVLSTLKPGSSFEGNAKVSLAEDNTRGFSGYVAGPLGNKAGFVLSGNWNESDGFYTNQFLNRNVVDNSEVTGINGRVIFELSDSKSSSLDLKARYEKVESASISFRAAFHLPGFAGINPAFNEDVNDAKFDKGYYGNIVPTNDQETLEFSVKFDHDFGNMALTAWALYSDVAQDLLADGTSADFFRYSYNAVGDAGAPWGFANPANGADAIASDAACDASIAANIGFALNAPGYLGSDGNFGSVFTPYSPTTCDGTQYQVRNQEDISFEVRLASTTSGPLQWQVGAYYLDIDREVGVSLGADLGRGALYNLYNAPGTANPTSQLFHDNFNTEVTAVFASFDYATSENLTLGLALRYDVEDREVTNRVPLVNDPITGGALNPGQDADGDGALEAIDSQSEKYQQFQPKLSLNYVLNDVTNIYANLGVGFKSGGFNNSGAAQIVTDNFAALPSEVNITDDFKKETSTAFEVGIRGTAGILNYSVAGYYTEVKDMQFFEFFVGTFGLLRVVNNIDEVEIYGLEASLDVGITDNLSLFGSVNLLESEIAKNSARPSTAGNSSPYTADYTVNLGVDYTQKISNNFNFGVRLDYRITGPTKFHTAQGGGFNTVFNAPGDYSIAERNEYGVANLRIGVSNDTWGVAVYADNLLDEEYLAEVITAAEFGGSFISPGSPRRIGAEVSVKF